MKSSIAPFLADSKIRRGPPSHNKPETSILVSRTTRTAKCLDFCGDRSLIEWRQINGR